MNLFSKHSIKSLLNKYRIHPSKRLGQNFLVDKWVLKKIIDAAELKSDDIVLEIGPGLGILTIELAKKVKKVIAVEKDKTLCQALENILKDQKINNVKVLNKDILDLELSGCDAGMENWAKKLATNNPTPKLNWPPNLKTLNYKLIANLPYYITSPVIRKFLESERKPKLMVLMVQKEVAQRICASPPHMNLLAVAVQFYAHPVRNKISNGAGPKIISYISKKSFWPIPRVDSAILRIAPQINADLNADLRGIDRDKFFELVKIGFSSKRKMLVNNLSEKIQNPKSKIQNLLEELGINPKVRAENLSIKDWLNLYARCYQLRRSDKYRPSSNGQK